MQQTLFEEKIESEKNTNSPLADRMRPETLDEFVGQEDVVGNGKLLRRMIEADKISSIIIYGPSGSGKTTLAKIIAKKTKANFYSLNAVTCGVKDIREVIEQASQNLGGYGKKSILFIDEIHRFNKAQQDALLPSVERGLITLIGATTENPYFEVNSPLISRSTVFMLKAAQEKDIKKIIEMALKNKERGLGAYNINLSEEAMEFLSRGANGDARVALNALELAFLTTNKDKNGIINIDEKIISECMQQKIVRYDKNSDEHYNTISAFIKSLRGSNPDAALYYMAKMLYAGEDPKFIARRMVIFASEDVGNAQPNALNIAVSTFRAVEIIGMPECRINLAQCVTYLACSPKSNASYMGLNMADEEVKDKPNREIPLHLRSANYKGAKELGYGIDYKYPHDFEGHYVKQEYMPRGLEGEKFYYPTMQGNERRMKEYLEWIDSLK